MTNAIYITTTEPRCGKSLVSIGIISVLLRKTSKIAVFRPIIDEPPAGQRDKNIDVLLRHFKLNVDYEDTYAYFKHEAQAMIGRGESDALMNTIIEKYKDLEDDFDFILCIGSDFESEETAYESDLNAQIAKNLGCPVLIVSRADGRNLETVHNTIYVTLSSFVEMGCTIAGIIINRAEPDMVGDLTKMVQNEVPKDTFAAVIPADQRLSSPTLNEIVEQLDAEVLYGEDQLGKLAYEYLVVSMTIHNYLQRLKENALLVTAGDREAILLSAVQAHQSRNYPALAGILLSGGLTPPDTVRRLLDGLPNMLPVLSVEMDTFETATALNAVRSYITADNPAKINLSLELFEKYVDEDLLEEQFSRIQTRGITPKMFIYNLTKKAKADKRHIVLPEGTDERILRATEILTARDVVDITLLGDPDEVRVLIGRLGLNIPDSVAIINPSTSEKLDEYAQKLYELRQAKGVNLDMAYDMMRDVSYYGTMMVYLGHADGMVSGAAHTTAHTIRPSLQFVKTKPGFSVVSSVFFMCLDDRVLVYGDCAINPNPTAQELAEIALASADTAEMFGVEPRVAMLSYSTGESGTGEDVDRVREATQIAQSERPALILEGPMQYDAAVSKDVAAKKMPGSKVAGNATVLIFPDLNTGNNTYKAVQRETNAIAVGPVLQGLKKPVNDLSRGCTVDDIVNTVAITAIQAQATEAEPKVTA